MMAPDPVDAAIAAAAAAAEQTVTVDMAQLDVNLFSGRPMRIALPIDFTDVEALQAVQALLIVMDQIRAARPTSRLVVVGANGQLKPT